ncbi:MAG TPA: hypothetical protein VHR45_24095 [Thermoanaerobaculia bacterium]|nr:hypothetical protein [Thermoanaerobaculia bacterium]
MRPLHVRPAGEPARGGRPGARPNRGGGTFNRSAVLQRSLAMLRAVLERSDPRLTRQLPEDIHALAVELLEEPWALTAFEIDNLAAFLDRTGDFARALAANVIPRQDFLQAISALTFAEKAALVDAAIQRHAPKAAMVAEPSPT